MVMTGDDRVASLNRSSASADPREGPSTDVGRVRNFWRTVDRVPAGAAISVRPGGRTRNIVVVTGWIAESRILPDGRRQIFAFMLPGDMAAVSESSHVGSRGLVALTNVEIADAAALGRGALDEPVANSLAEAMRRREERLFDHVVRIGRLSAMERVLNLLLELYDRLDAVGLVKDDTFRIPLTQEMFADALGLSVVHINRTLQQLRRKGMLTVGRGAVTLHDRQRLAAFACYESERPAERPLGRCGSMAGG
jgi:CRP-like cAMP-binding protein